YVTGVRSMIAGPSFEIHVSPNVSVEINALHKPLQSGLRTVAENSAPSRTLMSTDATTWQFPVLAKYRFQVAAMHPFIEAGPSFRLPQWDLSTHGITGGAGVEMRLHSLKIA